MSGADGERTGALPAGAGSQAAPSEVGSMGGAGLPSLPFSAAVKSCLFPSCQLREDLASQVASVWKVLIFLPLNSLNHHPTSLARWRRCLIWPHLCPLAGTPRPQSCILTFLFLWDLSGLSEIAEYRSSKSIQETVRNPFFHPTFPSHSYLLLPTSPKCDQRLSGT